MSQDSMFNDSMASVSQDVNFQILNPAPPLTRGKAVTFATMRGVINLFNHYFKQTDEFGNKKKMSRVEKQRRWVSYKQKIWNDYGRQINGTYASEQALIRRYSDPLTFLKYRLKRATNLVISELSEEDQAYYKEIGGTDDVQQLYHRQRNIDSLSNFTQPPLKRQRNAPHQVQSNRNYNQRMFTPEIQILNEQNFRVDNNHNRHVPAINQLHFSNKPTTQNCPPRTLNLKTENVEKDLDLAMDKLNDNLDIFEQEQLLKKKIEAYEITKEKVRALMIGIKTLLSTQPEMIGAIPGIGGLDEQLILFFDFWLKQNKTIILEDVTSKSLLMSQLTLFRSDAQEFNAFLQKWKLMRIFNDNSFLPVWNWMKEELNILSKADKSEKSNDAEDVELI